MTITLSCRAVNRCRCCAAAKKRRDRARAFMGAQESGRVALVTLTIDPGDPRFADLANRAGKVRPRTPELLQDPRATIIEHSLRYQQWAWNRLTTNLRRRVELGEVAYFKGVELQQSGMAHAHVLVRVPDLAAFWMLRRVLRGDEDRRTKVRDSHRDAGLAIRAGFGKVVDVQLAKSRADVASYVTKAVASGRFDEPRSLAGGPRSGTARGAASDAAAYVTKGVDAAMPRYTRRSSYSFGTGGATTATRPWAAGWVKPTRMAGLAWHLAPASEDLVRDALARSDFLLADPSAYRIPPPTMEAAGR